jgi:tripartite-type tricarboxylate transporter receptor subunit TctC
LEISLAGQPNGLEKLFRVRSFAGFAIDTLDRFFQKRGLRLEFSEIWPLPHATFAVSNRTGSMYFRYSRCVKRNPDNRDGVSMQAAALWDRVIGAATAALFALTISFTSALAQGYPNRPIRLLIPFPPGGAADVLGRTIAQKLGEEFGQSVISENRAGGNTIIAADAVAKAAPDGYTLLLAIDSTLAMNQTLFDKLPYDPLKDFAPIALVAKVHALLVAPKDSPVNNMKEMIALAKSQPDPTLIGSGTINTHLGAHLLAQMAGFRVQIVPYRGGASGLNATLSGQIPLFLTGAAGVIGNYKAGNIKALGVMGNTRLVEVPEIPPIAETVPGYDVFVWQSMVAPAKTPPEIIAKLNAAVVKIMKMPDVKARLLTAGIEATSSSPQELAAFIRSEAARWAPIIKSTGLKVD